MPPPDTACKVIHGKTGYVRDNTSWIISRLVRDFNAWKYSVDKDDVISKRLDSIINEKHQIMKAKADEKHKGSGQSIPRPKQAGLCVSVFTAQKAEMGTPGYDRLYWAGIATIILQLGIAVIPCGLFGDWCIVTVTAIGTLLALATGALSQWKHEKWACKINSSKPVVLTRGNGSQHAIVIIGGGNSLDLEDLATGQTSIDFSTSLSVRFALILLATFWILLLVTAASIKENTWYLVAVGGVGMLQNVFVAGSMRNPKSYGTELKFVNAFGQPSVMDSLFEIEKIYPCLGNSMLATFFPGKLMAHEDKWSELRKTQRVRHEQLKPVAEKAGSPAKHEPDLSPNNDSSEKETAATTKRLSAEGA